MIIETFKRSILKAVSWRCLAFTMTFLVVLIMTQVSVASSVKFALLISGFDLLCKSIVYFIHEQLWNKIKFGRLLTDKPGCCIWLTGLPCSGKTTIALKLKETLEKELHRVELLDGDTVRKNLCADLGFSKEDRDENIKRITLVSSYLSQRAITICSFVSPYKNARGNARNRISNFIEVFVDCPIEICIDRDVKGMYAKAIKGEISNFTGIDDPYEQPENPEIICKTNETSIDECAKKILSYLKENKLIT